MSKIEINVELTAPWQVRPVNETDFTWAQLLKIAQENHKLYVEVQKRLIKARAQKNEWKRKYEEPRADSKWMIDELIVRWRKRAAEIQDRTAFADAELFAEIAGAILNCADDLASVLDALEK